MDTAHVDAREEVERSNWEATRLRAELKVPQTTGGGEDAVEEGNLQTCSDEAL